MILSFLLISGLSFANTSTFVNYDPLGVCYAVDADPGFDLEIYYKRDNKNEGIIIYRNNEGGSIQISNTLIDWDQEYPLVSGNDYKLSVTISDEEATSATAFFENVSAGVECSRAEVN